MKKCICWCLSIIELENARRNIEMLSPSFTSLCLRKQVAVAVSCVVTWLPPNHRNSKRHRMSSAIQPLRKIFCTFTATYVRGTGFALVADLASEIQMISLFHYRGDGLSLSCKCYFTANVTKVISTANAVTRHH